MDAALNRLPRDPDALRAMIARQARVLTERETQLAEREAQLAEARAEVEAAKANVLAHEALIAALRLSIERLKRQRFGRSSEKIEREIAQLELALEGLSVSVASDVPEGDDPAANGGEEQAPTPAKRARRRRGRMTLPESLDRERIVLDPGDSCPECGGALRLVGEDVSQILEFIAAKLKVVETARQKKSCRLCEKMVQPPAPTRPIPRGLAGPGLLAHILVAKFDDHLPLYRQGEIFARHGVEIPRSTLIDWCGQAIRSLRPLVDTLKRHVLAADRLHADDTPVPVLDPARKTKTTKQGRLWVYVQDDRPFAGADPPAAAYFYSPDRKGEHPQAHLKEFRGVLQADGYAGFNDLYAPDRIGDLYDVERQINGQPAATRLAVRRQQTAPRVSTLKTWLEAQLARLPGKSELAKAIRYGLGRWPALTPVPRRRNRRHRLPAGDPKGLQCRRARYPSHRHRAKKLPVRRLRRRRRKHGRRPVADRDRQAERPQPRSLPRRHPRPPRRPQDQQNRPAPALELDPDRRRKKSSRLNRGRHRPVTAEALNAEENRAEAAEIIRSLVDRIELTPNADGKLDIDLYGDLAGILTMAANKNKPLDNGDESVRQVKLNFNSFGADSGAEMADFCGFGGLGRGICPDL